MVDALCQTKRLPFSTQKTKQVQLGGDNEENLNSNLMLVKEVRLSFRAVVAQKVVKADIV